MLTIFRTVIYIIKFNLIILMPNNSNVSSFRVTVFLRIGDVRVQTY